MCGKGRRLFPGYVVVEDTGGGGGATFAFWTGADYVSLSTLNGPSSRFARFDRHGNPLLNPPIDLAHRPMSRPAWSGDELAFLEALPASGSSSIDCARFHAVNRQGVLRSTACVNPAGTVPSYWDTRLAWTGTGYVAYGAEFLRLLDPRGLPLGPAIPTPGVAALAWNGTDFGVILRKVAERVNDAKVMRLLKLILKANGKRGVPQGGVISPLLSNLYLNEVDKMLERARDVTRRGRYLNVEYARFADDLVVVLYKYSNDGHTASSLPEILVNLNLPWSRRFTLESARGHHPSTLAGPARRDGRLDQPPPAGRDR